MVLASKRGRHILNDVVAVATREAKGIPSHIAEAVYQALWAVEVNLGRPHSATDGPVLLELLELGALVRSPCA